MRLGLGVRYFQARNYISSYKLRLNFSGHKSYRAPSSQLVLLPSSQHPGFTAIQQDWADQCLVYVGRERCLDCSCLHSPKKHLFAVWICHCISKLTSMFSVTRDPRYSHKFINDFECCFANRHALSHMLRIIRSLLAAIMYFILLSLIFSPTLFAFISNAR
jgi:hypothetical protein